MPEELLGVLAEVWLVWCGVCRRWGFDPREADITARIHPHPAGRWEVYAVSPTDLFPIDQPTEETE